MDLIETELTLCEDDDRICSCDYLVVADDDHRLFELGKNLIRESCSDKKAHQVMVRRQMLLSTINELNGRGFSTCGLIWSADLEEERLRGSAENIQEGGRVIWYDRDSIYGRPAIALLAPLGNGWNSIPGNPRIAVEERYGYISGRYVEDLRRTGYDPIPVPWSTLPFRGDLEEKADLLIARVDSPEIVDRTGMWPIDRIWESEPMIITSP